MFLFLLCFFCVRVFCPFWSLTDMVPIALTNILHINNDRILHFGLTDLAFFKAQQWQAEGHAKPSLLCP